MSQLLRALKALFTKPVDFEQQLPNKRLRFESRFETFEFTVAAVFCSSLGNCTVHGFTDGLEAVELSLTHTQLVALWAGRTQVHAADVLDYTLQLADK